jgi:predicted nucleic acid-binding protein
MSNKNYLIYLDVCCLNRPFDNLEQTRIRLEAESVTEIIQNCEKGSWQLINSDIIKFEINQHSDSFKLERINDILTIAKVYIESTNDIDLRTQELMKLSFKYHDALHLAFAEAGKADIFLTTDDRLLNKAKSYQNMLKIIVDNPVIWLMTVSQTKGENHEVNGN